MVVISAVKLTFWEYFAIFVVLDSFAIFTFLYPFLNRKQALFFT